MSDDKLPDNWAEVFNAEVELAKIPAVFTLELEKQLKLSEELKELDKLRFQDLQDNNKIIDTCANVINNNMSLLDFFKVVKINDVKCKPLKLVDRFKRLIHFYDISEQNKYFYVARQFTYNNKQTFNFCELPLTSINTFISDHLQYNNNLFEVIRSYSKVKLFFDLEYKLINEVNDYNKLGYDKLNLFKQFIKIKVAEILKIELHEEEMIILNSCYEDKLSFHIIINKVVFENMETHKFFIDYIISQLTTDTYYFELLEFIDHGIYTKNRNFRFINQSKINKNIVLKKMSDDINIYDTFITVYDNIDNYIKLDDIKHLEIIKNVTNKPSIKKSIKKELKIYDTSIYSPHFLDQPKENLKTIKNISDDEFKTYSYWKQYLYLIHQPLNWNEYFKVSCAVANCGGSVDEFKEWARLHPGFKEDDKEILTFENKKNYISNGPKYDINSLRKLAKLCVPEHFKNCPSELIKILVDLNIDDFEEINDKNEYVDMKGDILHSLKKNICIQANMGSGKTKAIYHLLLKYLSKKVLFISTRRTFADFITGEEYKELGFVNYQDFKGNEAELIKKKFIVCSLESLHVLQEIKKFDVVIMDECETILNQFDSTTLTSKGLAIPNFNYLKEYIKKSDKVIYADAFIMNRTLDFIRTFNGDKILLINDTVKYNYKSIEVHEDFILSVLIKSIQKGENNFCCFGSESKMRRFINVIVNDLKLLTLDEILYYSSTSDDNKAKNTLNDINNTWNKKRLILTTPTITIGCSFTEIHFHNTFIIGYPSCNARDIMQTHKRARVLINETVYYSIPEPKKYNFIRSQAKILLNLYYNYNDIVNYNHKLQLELLTQYEKNLDNNNFLFPKHKANEKERLDEYKRFFINNVVETTPPELRQIKLYNLLERALNGLHYKYMFNYFLKRCNYKYVDLIGEFEIIPIDEQFIEIDKIIITQEIADIIEVKEKNKQATEAEKFNLDKYYFYNFLNCHEDIDNIDNEEFNKIYLYYWQNKFNRSVLKNTKSEILNKLDLSKSVSELNDNTKTKYKFGKDDINNKIFRLNIINDVKQILNIKSTVEINNITREDIEKLTIYYTDVKTIDNVEMTQRAIIYDIFNIDKVKQGDKDLTFKTTLEFTNLILNNWNGSGIKGDPTKKDRKGIFSSYIISNNQIAEFSDKLKIDIIDLFKPKEEGEIEGDEENIINYNGNYNFHLDEE